MWSSLLGLVVASNGAESAPPSVELLSVPVLMTLGACASTAAFVWFVTEDRRRQIRRLDSLERGEKQTVRYLRAIMRKLEVSATDVMSESSHMDDSDSDSDSQ